MKNLRFYVVCVCITLMSSSNLFAQEKPPLNEPDLNRPTLFQDLPSKIAVNIDQIVSLFEKSIGSTIDLGKSAVAQFQFDGEVVSKASNATDGIQSVVIRSAYFNGAGITISKITDENGNATFRGRIISLKHGDLFVLSKENGGYVFVKKNYYDLVNE